MILLFKDFGTDYWIKNKIVDCGLSDTNQLTHINLELPDDELLYDEIPDNELPDDELPDKKLSYNELIFLDKLNVKTENIKKLNIKYKQHKSYNNNEPKYKKIYIGRNTEIIDRNSRKKDSRYKFGDIPSKYKDSNFRINNIQETSKHICIHAGIYSHNYKRKM